MMNDSTTISLSIGSNSIDVLPPDFDIKTDSATYRCHSHRIILFSPMVRKMYLSDPCIRSIRYPYHDDGYFGQIHNLIYGREISIAVDNSLKLLTAAMFFENSELSRGVTRFILNNYQKELLTSKEYFPLDYSLLYLRPSLTYITNNIQAFINSGGLKDYSLELLDVILGNPEQEIQIDNESLLFDWICQIVLSHKDKNPEYLSLFAHVCFDDLDTDRINKFLSICPVSAITGALWKAICCRLKIPVIETAQETFIPGPANFPYHGNMFDGVFHYLCKDNDPIDREIVMDCGGNKRWALANLLDPTDNSKFWENASSDPAGMQVYREEDQWIEVIFLNTKLRLTHYTIAHAVKAPNSTQPRNWKLLASTDGNIWEVIHEVHDAIELNCAAGRHTYEIPPNPRSFRHFKIQQTANFYKKIQTKHRFVLCAIEFFGNLEALSKS